jgi:signal transduction histidine kinase
MTPNTRKIPPRSFIVEQAQVLALQSAKRKVQEVRRQTLAKHQEVLRTRNARLFEFNEALKRTVVLVRERQQAATANLRSETISREVHVRVSRSLESLEQLVRALRQSSVSEEKMLEAVRDPVVSGTYLDRERRASVSRLVQSVQTQLVQQYEFLNVAAHELRTPIMPILANAEILKDRLQGDSKEIDTILRNALRLQRLAENILSATKIDSNTARYSMEEFDLNALLAQAVKDIVYTMNGSAVRILFIPASENLFVVGDNDRIGQVVTNLLDNAVHFTKEGRILVTSKSTEEFAEVSISDEGPGVDPQLYPFLFSKFAAKSSKGTGLGLFICKKVIEAHGGTIVATNRSVPGSHGAVFTFTLPL